VSSPWRGGFEEVRTLRGAPALCRLFRRPAPHRGGARGNQALLVEIQSLVNKTDTAWCGGSPRRRRQPPAHDPGGAGEATPHKFGNSDIFVSVAAAIRVTEPAADLGLALVDRQQPDNSPLPDGSL